MIRRKVTLRGLSSTPLIDSWVEKIPTAIEKQIDRSDESAIVDIDIRFFPHHASGERFFVEATLRARQLSLHAEAENENLPSAIEAVRDEIIIALASKKKKREHFIKKGGRAVKDFMRGIHKRDI